MTQDLTLSQNKEYRSWVKELKQRYLSARLKASVDANRTLLEYYWSLGRDIADKQYANTYGSGFYKTLSHDLRSEMPGEKGFSETNLKYTYYFYQLYSQLVENRLQDVDDFEEQNHLQGVDDLLKEICSIPWFHQQRIIDKCKGNAKKALFFVRKVIENSWGRDVLLNFLGTDLYERQAKAITNFRKTLPALQSDLAQQTTKDPYVFNFLAMTEDYNERELEDALGRQRDEIPCGVRHRFRLHGETVSTASRRKRNLHRPSVLQHPHTRYCCVELKTGSFEASQLGHVRSVCHSSQSSLKTEYDNPTSGLLFAR